MGKLRADIISQLQAEIYKLEGYKPSHKPASDLVLDSIQKAFPNGVFPIGAVHEFLPSQKEDMAAVSGFVAGLISQVMVNHGTTFWINKSHKIFPPALQGYGVQPAQFIFIDVARERDVMPVFYEALKCNAISAVVAEAQNLDFTTSRRLQLAVEQSHATGFVIRNPMQKINTTACVSRWKVSSLPSESYEGLPGIGFPKWRVELLRMRKGHTGVWDVQWINEKFASIQEAFDMGTPAVAQLQNQQRKAG